MTADPLNIAHLLTFAGVIEHGGFTRASHALHLSQSTVSQHVRALESRLGVPLLNREQGHLALTADGEAFLQEAHQLITAHNRMLERFDRPAGRTISIGSTEHAADHVPPSLIAALRLTYPEQTVTFHVNRSPALIDAVEQGRLDMALTLATTPQAPGIPLADLPLRWLTGTAPAPGGELRSESGSLSIVAFDGPCGIRERALRLLRDAQIRSQIAAHAPTLDGVRALAHAGLGVALLPVAADIPDGLHNRDDLPEAGTVAVHLLVREGCDPTTVDIARRCVGGLLGNLASQKTRTLS